MRGYDFQLIAKNMNHSDLLETFSQDYLLLFSWINRDIISNLPDSSLPIFQVIAQEIICAGAGCYWAYGPALRTLQVVSLHALAQRLNYQLEPDILVQESIEGFRRSEHVLEFILGTDWIQTLSPEYSYYFDQLRRLVSLVRQSVEQLELIHYAADLELIDPTAKPSSPPANVI